jgi:hypothetical protein
MDKHSGVEFQTGRTFSFLHCSAQIASGVHSFCDLIGGLSVRLSGVKETIYLNLKLKFKKQWSYTSIPPYVFIAWCSTKHRDKFNFEEFYLPGCDAV